MKENTYGEIWKKTEAKNKKYQFSYLFMSSFVLSFSVFFVLNFNKYANAHILTICQTLQYFLFLLFFFFIFPSFFSIIIFRHKYEKERKKKEIGEEKNEYDSIPMISFSIYKELL